MHQRRIARPHDAVTHARRTRRPALPQRFPLRLDGRRFTLPGVAPTLLYGRDSGHPDPRADGDRVTSRDARAERVADPAGGGRQGARGERSRQDPGRRPHRDRGLSRRSKRDHPSIRWALDAHGRHRPDRRRWLPAGARSTHGPDHLRRREYLPGRSRVRAPLAPGRARGRRGGPAPIPTGASVPSRSSCRAVPRSTSWLHTAQRISHATSVPIRFTSSMRCRARRPASSSVICYPSRCDPTSRPDARGTP